jgi:hypothetical protein
MASGEEQRVEAFDLEIHSQRSGRWLRYRVPAHGEALRFELGAEAAQKDARESSGSPAGTSPFRREHDLVARS